LENCDRHKRKFYYGSILAIGTYSFKVIDQNYFPIIDFLGLSLFLIIVTFNFVLAMYLCAPYVGCLTDSNNRKNPPFS